MKSRHFVCLAAELPPGERRIITVGRKSVGVFNVQGEYFALLNVCPHQFAPLCEGRICGYSPPSPVGEFHYEREGEIVRCPWHGWEFDIKTGRSIFNPYQVRTASYPVSVDAADDAAVETFPIALDDQGVWVEV